MTEILGNIKNNSRQTYAALKGNEWRSSTQPLLAEKILKEDVSLGSDYDTMPFYALGSGKIFSGYESLCEWIISQKCVLIDGYSGIFFEDIQQQIQQVLAAKGLSVEWHFTAEHLKTEAEIDKLVKPFLGGENEVWGTKTDLNLKDFFDMNGLLNICMDNRADVNIVIGTGAGLLDRGIPVVYFDIPKNEIQYRMRAKSVSNLGQCTAERPFNMYKRFYFVDWVVLNQYKAELMSAIAIVADGQRLTELSWLFQKDLLEGLNRMSHSVIRARPWFEKGSWGGQWMKKHFKALNAEEVNYAWSFELITPENGLLFESDGNLLEIPFDTLMLTEYKAVLGTHADMFGAYFPIRFDFLDTFNGGNLSIQCHPSKDYIRTQFGETITQDETYYILDCEPDAKVYLGFQENIDPTAFRAVLEHSQQEKEKIDIEQYVQSFPSHKHDLFLIPNGTVHSSGVNNMVLEISATPYIFTFKMYDWLSLDLNGKPRPINIDHAFNNLRFERKGDLVEKELISHPVTIDSGKDWELIHLPTHEVHFYDVHRVEFDTEVVIETRGVCHVLMLVEGTTVAVEIAGQKINVFSYAETFIIPAAVEHYKLINKGTQRAKVVKAFLKDGIEI